MYDQLGLNVTLNNSKDSLTPSNIHGFFSRERRYDKQPTNNPYV
jgi:hypothetical protein